VIPLSSQPVRKPEHRRPVLFPLDIRALAFAVFLLASAIATGPVEAQQLTFHHYGQDEGLRNLDIFGIEQDNSGLLWLASENGLFRYDGASFRHFGQEDGIGESLVLGLHKDASGRIWVTTNDHLYFFNGTGFTAVPTGQTVMQFGAGQRITSIDAGHILFLARGSLVLISNTGGRNGQPEWNTSPFFTPAQIATHPELAQLHSIFVSPNSASDHDLWLGCGQSICRIHEPLRGAASLQVFSQAQAVPSESWICFFEDSHGALWARSGHHILTRAHDEASFHSRDIEPTDDLTAYRGSGLLTFAEDPQGRILTQTNRGLARWEGSAWRVFDASNGIDFKDVSTILFDHRGSPWFSTRGHGVYRWLGYGTVENWTVAQGLRDDVVWPIFRDSHARLWIADQFQINQLDETTHRLTSPRAFQASPVIHGTAFAESPGGSLWVFRINGEVLRTDSSAAHITFRTKLPDIARTFTDSAHRIWILSREGLYVIRTPDAPSIEKLTDQLVSTDAFADEAESPDHDLWFLADNHLYKLSHTNNSFSEIKLDAIATRGQMRNIAAASDSTLWIGGGLQSLLHLRVDGDRATTLSSVTMPDLISTNVQIVRLDKRGWLWVGTDLGINVFDGKTWRLLTRRDGIISNDTDEGAFLTDRDGSVWIGVNGGAIHMLHPEALFSTTPLDVRFTSASLGDKTLSLSSTTLTRWQDDSLDLNFTSLNFDREGSVRFRYRLAGLENGWSETTSHTLHYSAVPPGDYRFELQSIDPDQQRQSPPISFTFTIRPPWWRTKPLYLLLTILSFLASILIWHWRERRLIRKQRMLRHLVAQRTRELEAEKAELVAAREALRRQATRDALTGLWNRPAILDILIREMDRANREGKTLALVLADIDHFKQINDNYGHLAGDDILREAARRMLNNIRPYDFLGRYGGEEFLIVLPGLPEQDPHGRLKQLQNAISNEPFRFEDRSVRVTSSFGAAWLNPTIAHVEDLVRRADEALYQAKARGRDRIVFYRDRCEEPEDQYSN
jgi:diguanylate cyclase (GGDEF)-like protein